MERLKALLADKIIDVSSENTSETPKILDKINRFRDFAFACEALMQRYPQIEDELIAMLQANDFDTRVASSRVNHTIQQVEAGVYKNTSQQTDDKEINNTSAEGEGVQVEMPDLVILEPEYPDTEFAAEDNAPNSQQVAEAVIAPTQSTMPKAQVEFDYTAEETSSTANVKRVFTVIALVAGACLLIWLTIKYWKPILYALGGMVALIVVVYVIWRVYKNKQQQQ